MACYIVKCVVVETTLNQLLLGSERNDNTHYGLRKTQQWHPSKTLPGVITLSGKKRREGRDSFRVLGVFLSLQFEIIIIFIHKSVQDFVHVD